MPKAKGSTEPPHPDKLVRQSAGTYRTADDRFEVRGGTSNGWFLVDAEQTNDFGQELIQGPFATLAAVRAAIPSARSAKVTPIRPLTAPKKSPAKGRTTKRPLPPPPSWIDELPTSEGAAVRRLIRALEAEGIGDAEALVRRDRDGIGPAIATRVIERRLAAIVDELPEAGRAGARDLVRRATEVLTAEGTAMPRGVPGWSLVEIGPQPEPDNRRITIRELPGGGR
jgi:hypothetical protein